jgi:plastocyanin
MIRIRNPWRQIGVLMSALLVGHLAAAASLVVTVLDKEGKPAPNAVISITYDQYRGAPNPAPQVLIEQEKMRFVPEVTLAYVGTVAKFVNKDSWDHHLRTEPMGMDALRSDVQSIEFRLSGKVEGKPPSMYEARLDVAGSRQLSCHIHGSMRGFIYISDTPFAAKTNADGVALLENLPEGAARMKVWHPAQLLDLAPQNLSVQGSQSLTVNLSVVTRRKRY